MGCSAGLYLDNGLLLFQSGFEWPALVWLGSIWPVFPRERELTLDVAGAIKQDLPTGGTATTLCALLE